MRIPDGTAANAGSNQLNISREGGYVPRPAVLRNNGRSGGGLPVAGIADADRPGLANADGDTLSLEASRARRFVERFSWPSDPPLEVVERFNNNMSRRASFSSKDGDSAEFDPRRSRNSFGVSPEMGADSANSVKPKGQCRTCSSRKYVDGSNDASVSYQTPTKINPRTAAMAVASHEREHIVNQKADAIRNDREIVQQSVSIKYAVCPECNIMYPSGGTARTTSVSKGDGAESDAQAQKNAFGGNQKPPLVGIQGASFGPSPAEPERAAS